MRAQYRPTAEIVKLFKSTGPARLTYVGFFGAVADGKVGSGGDLRASLAQSGEVVLATGALRDRGGFGQWSSPSLKCQGTWSAHKGK